MSRIEVVILIYHRHKPIDLRLFVVDPNHIKQYFYVSLRNRLPTYQHTYLIHIYLLLSS
jgi:hypothetical protein